jgi:hypothetical protein
LARPGRGRPRRLRRGLAALAAACIGAVALGLALPDLRSLPGTGVPGDGPAATSSAAAADSVPTPPEAVPEPTPEPTPPAATVVVDFRHTLRTGSLRIWMDDEAVLGAPVHGRVSKNLHLVKLRSGTLTDVLEVPPGRHDFLVDVRWDDEQRRERIAGLVHPGETYRLEIRLGRIRKNLSVKWTR